MSIFIISEIGINHNGDLDTAKKLIDMAKTCGCDAVKFQKRTVDVVYTKEFLDSPRESPWGTTQRAQKEGLEFDIYEYDIINRYCKAQDIPWFASAWDLESQKFLRWFDTKYNKIASAMLTYEPLLEMVAAEKKHTFISTGMSDYDQIDHVVDIFKTENCPFTLMHCISTYPCMDEECNLLVIPALKKRYGCEVGYSGHETGLLPSIVAVTLGATVIERHISLNRCAYGSDQAASLEKHGLEVLVRDLRLIKAAMGTGEKIILESELKTARSLRYFDTWSDTSKGR